MVYRCFLCTKHWVGMRSNFVHRFTVLTKLIYGICMYSTVATEHICTSTKYIIYELLKLQLNKYYF